MNLIEIVMIVIGIITIVISCRLVERQSETSGGIHRVIPDVEHLSEDEKVQIKEKIKELLSEISEETVVRTDDYLSKISNEKIMAVNDFSDQILEKIKSNHEEVVFLYNMLNEKEKELKTVIREIDTSKQKVKEILDMKKEMKEQPKKTVSNQTSTVTQVKSQKPAKQEKRPVSDVVLSDTPVINSLSTNNNTQILSLYNKGKSVVEISKLLGLGQGEVKLVIDLFKGKK
ncbi:hypothetical protein I5677_14040 [Mobilitalea sibirica]|uniref:Uncharacterized protein n=1 Tax=Mobilitalea sibirica TaxID=1462919 RepID=A0A8J7L0C0_9FIRM|nr:DUF6115 domain-containing protein [Mobilitalea sibirica]MBH1942018.1 hypothetical protein [Mobilitalea sibirica]